MTNAVRFMVGATVCGALLAMTWSEGMAFRAAQQHPSRHVVTKDMLEDWMRERSNWNRWGKEDERGTLNLLTPERTRKAVALVDAGVTVSLSHPVLEQKADDVALPFLREMAPLASAGEFATDRYSVSFHGFAHSHVDALCHDSWRGTLYNDFPKSAVTQAEGCMKNGISTMKDGIVTRGVLVDIPRLKGAAYLEPSTPIYIEDLEAWEKQVGTRMRAGDMLLLRTGRWARRKAKGAWPIAQQSAGLHASVLPWLKARDIALLGTDAMGGVLPSGVDGVMDPIHQFALVALGMPLFDNLDLEAAAIEAAKRHRWAFLVTAAPLVVTGGTGSPVNPVAIF